MKTKLRICIIPLLITFLIFALLLWSSTPTIPKNRTAKYLKSFRKPENRIDSILDRHQALKLDQTTAHEDYMRLLIPNEVDGDFTPNSGYIEHPVTAQECDMISCFNFSRCLNGFSVYVYESPLSINTSPLYEKILRAIRSSPYLTTDPHTACVLVPPYDTLDRDALSADYETRLKEGLITLPYWNSGLNHLIFNFFSGTSPFYSHSLDSLNLDLGKAILVKASLSASYYRRDFDISSPLIPKDFPLTHPNTEISENLFTIRKKYKLTFKGKRYLWGTGSLVRNALFNIDNGDDVILLTTCVHGRYWFKMQDYRCEADNLRYDEFEYNELMLNSSFCLVPRGRRLGSFRFLESLETACLPVSLSNGFILPFSEVADWRLAGFSMDERHLMQVPIEVRSIPDARMLAMQIHSHFLWSSYLSSTTKFVQTVFEILRDRIYPHAARSYNQWNYPPGAIYTGMKSSKNRLFTQFTAVLRLEDFDVLYLERIWNLIECVNLMELILVSSESIYEIQNLPEKSNKIRTFLSNNGIIASSNFKTEAVINLNIDTIPAVGQIEFAFSVWKEFPERLVGFKTLSHLSNENIKYPIRNTLNSFSLISPIPGFYHAKYNSDFSKYIPNNLLPLATESLECMYIGMNYYISHLTHSPPIKIAGFLADTKNSYNKTLIQSCTELYLEIYGYNPLLESHVQFVPLSS